MALSRASTHLPTSYSAVDYAMHRRFLLNFHAALFVPRQHPVTGEHRRVPLPPAYIMEKEGHVFLDRLVKWFDGYVCGYIDNSAHPEFLGFRPAEDPAGGGISFDFDTFDFKGCYKYLKEMPFMAAAAHEYTNLIVHSFPGLAFGPGSLYGLSYKEAGHFSVSSKSDQPFDFKKALLHPETIYPAWPFPLCDDAAGGEGVAGPAASGGGGVREVARGGDVGHAADGIAGHAGGGDVAMCDANAMSHSAQVSHSCAVDSPSCSRSALPPVSGPPMKKQRGGSLSMTQFSRDIRTWRNNQNKDRRLAFEAEMAKQNKQKRNKEKKSFRPNKEGGSDN